MTNDLSNEDFMVFSAPDNWVAQLLLLHFFMLEYVLGETILGPRVRAYNVRKIVTFKWLERLAEKLPTGYKKYIQWLRTFALSVLASNIHAGQQLREGGSRTIYAITEVD